MNTNKLSSTLGRIEEKIDGLHDDIVELKDADNRLHERISNKDVNVRKLETRVSKLESGWAAIKWLLGGLVAAATAIGTFLAGRN